MTVSWGDQYPARKFELINDQGKYLGVRAYNYFINLYFVDDTFIEVWYFRPGDKIEKIEILDNLKKVDLYINQMNMK